MAKNVWITVPVDRPLGPEDAIVVRDDGFGMSYEEVNDSYLMVGRNRRLQGDLTEPYNGLPPRHPQGRKGIGKLAGFGIAQQIEVRTVKKRNLSHLSLDFDALTESQEFANAEGYEPDVFPDDGSSVNEKPSTTITLSKLKVHRAINEDQLVRGLARRLLVLDKNFRVHVNGTRIERTSIPFQFRFPKSPGAWATEQLADGNEFKWWAGFTKQPIPEEDQRGFVVYVRGKLAQTPWFFDLSGGAWGQHGLQYLTGEVQADFLDDAVDLIATDRGSVRWEEPIAAPLREWGQKKVAQLLRQWSEKRRKAKIESPKITSLLELAKKLPQRERSIFERVVNQIVSIPQLDKTEDGKDIAEELVEFAYNALTNKSFMDAIRRLNATSTEDRAQFEAVLTEWDIIEAVNTAHIVKGRVEIIRKFEEMIRNQAPEKPHMQDYVRDHPWLIDPKWTMLTHERSLDTTIAAHFGLEQSGAGEGQRRLDFFCLGDRNQTAYVIEAKRPGALVGRTEFDQLRDYVLYLRERLIKEADEANRRTTVHGLLIADRIRSGDEGHAEAARAVFERRTWGHLLQTAETLHEDFLKVVRLRAPADDPRMENLMESNSPKKKKHPTRKRAGAAPKRAKKTKPKQKAKASKKIKQGKGS